MTRVHTQSHEPHQLACGRVPSRWACVPWRRHAHRLAACSLDVAAPRSAPRAHVNTASVAALPRASLRASGHLPRTARARCSDRSAASHPPLGDAHASGSGSSSGSTCSSNSAMPSVSVNHSVWPAASTMPAGHSYGPKSPESAFATIGARLEPAAETSTTLAAFITSMLMARKSPSARSSLPASTTLPAPVALISGVSGKRQPQ
mmetsp:Transcript_74767/g.206216  ORF Transcript_74767/g.206216 Transcript_74767/m.206216 type:complete len:205 (-) Transcript_74767:540-1154(-)